MKATAALWEEHKAVLRMLVVLETMVAQMGKGQPPPADDLRKVVQFLEVFVDRCHHGKEEQVLFPALMRFAEDENRQLIERLLDEHREGRDHLASLASAVGIEMGAEPDVEAFPACRPGEEAEYATNGYVALLRPHITAEQKTLFPWADAILPPEVQEELEAGYTRFEIEVIGAGGHEALADILDDLRRRYGPSVR